MKSLFVSLVSIYQYIQQIFTEFLLSGRSCAGNWEPYVDPVTKWGLIRIHSIVNNVKEMLPLLGHPQLPNPYSGFKMTTAMSSSSIIGLHLTFQGLVLQLTLSSSRVFIPPCFPNSFPLPKTFPLDPLSPLSLASSFPFLGLPSYSIAYLVSLFFFYLYSSSH